MKDKSDTISREPGTSRLVRAKFGPGMLLQHDDLEMLNTYTRELSRLMFRSLFGCGVICGLVVKPKTVCEKPGVEITPGVALTCSGDPIWVSDGVSLMLNKECDKPTPPNLWVILCRKTKCCGPRVATCSSDDDEVTSVCTREIEGYEIRIVDGPAYGCSCVVQTTDTRTADPNANTAAAAASTAGVADAETAGTCPCVGLGSPCYKKHYDGECGCECDDCKDCDCDCVLLARLEFDTTKNEWKEPDHSVRRFVRPVLMTDPKTRTVTPPPSTIQIELETARAEYKKLEQRIKAKETENKRLHTRIDKLKQENDAKKAAADAAAAKLAAVLNPATPANDPANPNP